MEDMMGDRGCVVCFRTAVERKLQTGHEPCFRTCLGLLPGLASKGGKVIGKISLADGVSPGDYISTYVGGIYSQALRMLQEQSSCPDEEFTYPDKRVHNPDERVYMYFTNVRTNEKSEVVLTKSSPVLTK